MVTSSPTRMPPVSSAAFQFRPNSLRLILVLAARPRRVFPQGSLAGGVGPSTVNTTLRVTPRIVSSPATANSPSPTRLMRVELNDSVGTFSTSSAYGGRIDRGLHVRVGDIGFIQRQDPLEARELPLYVGNHHVLDLELGHRVNGVDVPGGGCGLRSSHCAHILTSFLRMKCVIACLMLYNDNRYNRCLSKIRSAGCARRAAIPSVPARVLGPDAPTACGEPPARVHQGWPGALGPPP